MSIYYDVAAQAEMERLLEFISKLDDKAPAEERLAAVIAEIEKRQREAVSGL